MTSIPIVWTNIKAGNQVFAVFHRTIPEAYTDISSRTLLIPDRWENNLTERVGRFLVTEELRRFINQDAECIVVEKFPVLDDGDVVFIDGNLKRLEVVFNVKGNTNSLYVTNACNSKCQFCPQPSTADDGWLYDMSGRIIDLIQTPGECVNITGGEPTIRRDKFIALLKKFSCKWNRTKAFVLTNGRLLNDSSYVMDIFSVINHDHIAFGIPLYADAASVHDMVVGASGAFGQTIRGLYNLAANHAEIEIRFVLSRITYRRLPQLVQYIGRNLPFVTRIAVMGIEPMGHCRNDWERYWVDPEDAEKEITQAISIANNFSLNVLLYNFQLCCLPRALRQYACPSISEWKRVYIAACLYCPMKSDCGGFFASQNKPQYLPRRFSS